MKRQEGFLTALVGQQPDQAPMFDLLMATRSRTASGMLRAKQQF